MAAHDLGVTDASIRADFLAALEMDNIQPDDPEALDVRQLMGVMGVTTHKTAKEKADKAVKAGRLASFKTRRGGRVVSVYKIVTNHQVFLDSSEES